MLRRLALALLLVWAGASAYAAISFPALTSHVVDDAHLLSNRAVSYLDEKLMDYERGTTNQVVVVTLPSLQGTSIEDYGYQLGRHWGIGQKGKNNGVLFIVAPSEHHMRIEVGYGLEATLTDAQASQIISQIVTPEFKAGKMQEGVVDGTNAILSVLGGQGMPASAQNGLSEGFNALHLIFFLVLFILYVSRPSFMTAMLLNSAFRSGSSYRGGSAGWSGGGGGGGWSGGGGGSFGGGGSSGSW